MNFSVPLTEDRLFYWLGASLRKLVREPIIRQIMRISILLMGLLLTSLEMLLATPGHGQGAENTSVALELKGESLESALKRIEDLTPFRFVYRNSEIKNIHNLTLPEGVRTVSETLSIILENTSLTFKLVNNSILIVPKGGGDITIEMGSEEGLGASVQQRIVTGRVISADDNGPLPGVNVLVQGTQTGAVTDAKGNYNITVATEDAVLVFSFIGYKSQEVPVAGRSLLDVSLESDITQLSEVVVTAFGLSQEKKALISSTQEVAGKELIKSKEANLVDALNAKVAGVQVTRQAGSAGAASAIVIRGYSSISGENQPLFVVDGIPINNSVRTPNRESGVDVSNRAIDINPNDIESINVLKGPAATALYGLQAGSGVIIITTKKGSRTDGRNVKVNFSSNYSIEKIMNYFPAQMRYAQGDNGIYNSTTFSHFGPPISTLRYDGSTLNPANPLGYIVDMNDPSAKADLTLTPVDNQKVFYQDGHTFDNNLSISSGNKNGSFYLSLGNNRQDGIIPENEYNRTTIKITGETSLRDNLRLTGSANYVYSTSTRFGRGDNFDDVVQGTIRTPPSFDNSAGYVLENGDQRSYRYDPANPNLNGPDNPFWVINNNPYTDEVNRLIGFLQANYDPMPWLNIMYRVGTDVSSDKRDQVWAKGSRGGDGQNNGRVQQNTYNDRIVNSDLIVTASKKFNEFNTSLMVGHNFYSNSSKRQFFDGQELAIPGLYTISNATSKLVQIQNTTKKETVAALARLTFDYKSMVFLELNGRNEWTSTLVKPNNRFFYGSAGVGFIFTEVISTDQSVLSFGKIKGSYAESGRDTRPYQTETYYVKGGSAGVWGGSINFPIVGSGLGGFELENTAGNPLLKPERNKTFEAGAELKFFNNKLSFDATYYRSLNTDQIISITVPGSTGFLNQITNAGELENKGIELVASGTPLSVSGLRWDITANFTRNRNLVLSLPVDRIPLAGFGNLRPIVKEGEPYSVFYGTGFLRNEEGRLILTSAGYPQLSPATEQNPSGDLKLGNPNPDWLLGLRNTFSYKDFSLTFLWDFRKGGDVANVSSNWQRAQGVPDFSYDRGHLVVFDGVYEDGTENTKPVLIDASNYYTTNAGNRNIAERFVEDGSWVRLRDVSLTYSLPKSLLRKLSLQSVDVSLYGRNLLLFTGYTGIDPETNFAGPNSSIGVDAFGTPTTRSFGISLNASL